jgi:hypothetical protein
MAAMARKLRVLFEGAITDAIGGRGTSRKAVSAPNWSQATTTC